MIHYAKDITVGTTYGPISATTLRFTGQISALSTNSTSIDLKDGLGNVTQILAADPPVQYYDEFDLATIQVQGHSATAGLVLKLRGVVNQQPAPLSNVT
jgi:hypothetical protein